MIITLPKPPHGYAPLKSKQYSQLLAMFNCLLDIPFHTGDYGTLLSLGDAYYSVGRSLDTYTLNACRYDPVTLNEGLKLLYHDEKRLVFVSSSVGFKPHYVYYDDSMGCLMQDCTYSDESTSCLVQEPAGGKCLPVDLFFLDDTVRLYHSREKNNSNSKVTAIDADSMSVEKDSEEDLFMLSALDSLAIPLTGASVEPAEYLVINTKRHHYSVYRVQRNVDANTVTYTAFAYMNASQWEVVQKLVYNFAKATNDFARSADEAESIAAPIFHLYEGETWTFKRFAVEGKSLIARVYTGNIWAEVSKEFPTDGKYFVPKA